MHGVGAGAGGSAGLSVATRTAPTWHGDRSASSQATPTTTEQRLQDFTIPSASTPGTCPTSVVQVAQPMQPRDGCGGSQACRVLEQHQRWHGRPLRRATQATPTTNRAATPRHFTIKQGALEHPGVTCPTSVFIHVVSRSPHARPPVDGGARVGSAKPSESSLHRSRGPGPASASRELPPGYANHLASGDLRAFLILVQLWTLPGISGTDRSSSRSTRMDRASSSRGAPCQRSSESATAQATPSEQQDSSRVSWRRAIAGTDVNTSERRRSVSYDARHGCAFPTRPISNGSSISARRILRRTGTSVYTITLNDTTHD
jgi:hypothetical protein